MLMLNSKTLARIGGGLFLLGIVVIGLYLFYDRQRVQEVRFAAGKRTSQEYALAEQLAQILTETGVHVRLIPVETDGGEANMALLKAGQVDLATGQLDATTGLEPRMVALLWPEVFELVVHEDSSIQSVRDLQGKTVAIGSEEGSVHAFLLDVLRFGGLSTDTVKLAYLPFEEAYPAFVEHKVDAVFRCAEPNSSKVTQLLKGGPGRLLPFDQFEAMRLQLPYLFAMTLPPGIYEGGSPGLPSAPVPTVGSYKALFAHARLSPAVVQAVTRALFEHRNALTLADPLLTYLKPASEVDVLAPPVHPGAQAYFDRDQPNFLERYQTEISFALTVVPLGFAALMSLRSRLQAKQKIRQHEHRRAVLEALAQLAQTDNLDSLRQIENRLLIVLTQFEQDLNEGQLNAEEAASFSLIWDKTLALVRYRAELMRSAAPET